MTRRDLIRTGLLAVILAPFAALFRKREETGTGYFWQRPVPHRLAAC